MKLKMIIFFLFSFFINVAFGASLTTWKNNYDIQTDVWIQLHDKPRNEKDWIGIYPKNASNDWDNVVSWVWANDTSVTQYDEGDWYKFEDTDSDHFGESGYFTNYSVQPPAGEYEARFFLNDGYQLEAKTVVFRVGNEVNTQLVLDKQNYATNDSVQVNFSSMLGDPQDWFAIYKKGDSNDWGNVKAWSWSGGLINGAITMNYKNLTDGDYEVRGFFKNSYELEKSISFTINKKEYWEKGSKEVVHKRIGDAVVYYPKNLNREAANVVFLAQGAHADPESSYPTLLNFIASQGYYVIGVDLFDNNGTLDLFHPRTVIAQRYVTAVQALRAEGENINTDKIGVVGTSSGGGNTFSILYELKENHSYGADGSFILAMESWYAFEMSETQLESLSADGKTNTVILEFGEKGNVVKNDPLTGKDYSTDALLPLTNFYHISKNYPENSDYQVYERNSVNDSYTTHLYSRDNAHVVGSEGEKYVEMKGLLNPLGALISLTFGDGDNGKARNIALNSGSDTPVVSNLQHVKGDKVDYNYPCNWTNMGINYCKFDNVRNNIPNL